ncbi:hypothetical protein VW29_13755 [Devosia limi DSM 17137]|uniref:Uncharacterized protein n=1 Tax=Devosia limi DSM 17137 TaxID=1121477 RepID=A0A0F5LNQ2_9HYPH|nr:hypothetical protein VW29_13755 [Devosia limi DSM 17137]
MPWQGGDCDPARARSRRMMCGETVGWPDSLGIELPGAATTAAGAIKRTLRPAGRRAGAGQVSRRRWEAYPGSRGGER